MASRYLRGGRGSGTLQPTGLVHEAYIRLSGAAEGTPRWRDREHFCAIAAQAMRQIVIDGGQARRG